LASFTIEFFFSPFKLALTESSFGLARFAEPADYLLFFMPSSDVHTFSESMAAGCGVFYLF